VVLGELPVVLEGLVELPAVLLQMMARGRHRQ
jgi:hypothetical protein